MTTPRPLTGWRYVLSPQLLIMCIIALLMACVWWQLAYTLRDNPQFLVWDDQKVTFLRDVSDLRAPYTTIPGFVNPPWTLLILAPLKIIPQDMAIFLQIAAYFVLIAMLIRKFGGGVLCALIVFTAPLAPDAVINLNIDWIVVLGLLIPRAWSAPFLLTKPQNALGYVLSFDLRTLVYWSIGAGIVVLFSFVIWGWWIPDWLTQLEVSPVTWLINLAPRALIGDVPAIALGSLLVLVTLWRRDPILGIFSGLFFVPYIASYSLLMPFALLTVRSKIAAFTASISIWVLVIIVVLRVFDLA